MQSKLTPFRGSGGRAFCAEGGPGVDDRSSPGRRTRPLRRGWTIGRPPAGTLAQCLALCLVLVALASPPARAQTALGLPLVVPRESIALLRALNRATHFDVLSYSEVTLDKRVVQTAVVNVIQGGGFFLPPRLALFLPAGDVTLVQQLNQELPIQLLAYVQMVTFPPLTLVPSGLVLITTPADLPKIDPKDCLLALPVGSFSLTVQLNSGGSFSFIRVTQISIGGSGGTHVIYVALRQSGAGSSFTLIVPEADLPELMRLNKGLTFTVVRVYTTTPLGSSTEVRVAEVTVTCNPKETGGGA